MRTQTQEESEIPVMTLLRNGASAPAPMPFSSPFPP